MTGRSFYDAIRAAQQIDDSGIDSAPGTPPASPAPSPSPTAPSSPLLSLTPSEGSCDSMDVPRSSSARPPPSPFSDEPVSLPPASQWETGSERSNGGSSECSTDGGSEWSTDCGSDYGESEYGDPESEYGDPLSPPLGPADTAGAADAPAADAGAKKWKRKTLPWNRSARKQRRGAARRRAAEMLGPTDLRAPTFRVEPASLATGLDSVFEMPAES